MSHISRIQAARTILLASALAVASLASWAARDFTPQAGTWVISEEVDGNPGRGLAIDVQGNTLILQVFGYEPNGDATFYMAAGQLQGDTITAPLMRYTSGRSFGSEARDAVEDRSLGNVTLRFRNGLQGTIEFPGEPEREFERFIFAQRDDPHYQTERWQKATREAQWFALNAQGQVVNTWQAALQWSSVDSMRLVLRAQPHWSDWSASSSLECVRPAQSQSIRCVAANVADSPVVKEADFRLVGAQVTGAITLQEEGAAPLQLQGINTMSYECCGGIAITGYTVFNGIESHVGYDSWVGYGANNTSLPSNGTWVMQDELTGKPGRGVSLDVQGGKLLMQVFGYRADGQPTFHMGVGDYASQAPYSYLSSARFNLQQYGGGRSVGGAAASAHWVQDAGEVVVSVSGARDATLAQAMVQFPGEESKRMQRFSLETPHSIEDQFFGEWYFPSLARVGGPMTVTLNRIDGEVATNEDGSVRCQLNAQSQRGECQASGAYTGWNYIDLTDEFVILKQFVRVRDRHGNLTGLGNVPLE